MTGCGSSGSSDNGPTGDGDDSNTSGAQEIVNNGDFTGSGALSAATRYLANDATVRLPSTAGLTDVNTLKADQTAIATLAATKTTDTTTLKGKLTGTINLTNDKKYKVDGLVKIDDGATLNIEAGTIIYGDATGDDFIVVMQGAKIIAEGTEDDPIIFTSETALNDANTADVGQWGGLTILGKAPTNHDAPFYEVDESDPDFAFGNSAAGAGDAADNSGILKNVYILNSGVTMSTDQEVNGLSFAGVGSGTTVENIHIENSSDDGIEIWGGTVNVTNATLINCQDDSFDLDYGYVGTATNIQVFQTEAAYAGFEISSGGTNPMTSPKIVNFTINKVDGSDEGGIYIKDDSTAPTFVNGMITTHGTDAAIFAKKAMPADQEAALSFKDVAYSIK
jgi:hypothetical protein